MPGTLRFRFALLYAGALALSGSVVLSVAFLASKQVVLAGGPKGPEVTTHPMRGQVLASVISLGALALVSVASGWLLAGRMLRPVQAITTTAREISAGNLSRRLSHGRRDDELTRLSQTLNDLFARLEASFQAQRHFVASASHELRTPLTAERTVLQVALADPDADSGDLRAACQEVLRLGEQQERLIDALLTLAISEQGIEHQEPFDLAVIAGKVIAEQGPCGVRVDTHLQPAPAAGDPSLAASLVTNLVRNALRYNQSDGWVSVETRTTGRRAALEVRNSGPVIPPGEVDRLFEPFRRHGRERTRHGDGHGLGLAIVAAIVRAHDADLSATARPEGGLDITVTFRQNSQVAPAGE